MMRQNKQENKINHLALRRSHAFESIDFENGRIYINRKHKLALRRSSAYRNICVYRNNVEMKLKKKN